MKRLFWMMLCSALWAGYVWADEEMVYSIRFENSLMSTVVEYAQKMGIQIVPDGPIPDHALNFEFHELRFNDAADFICRELEREGATIIREGNGTYRLDASAVLPELEPESAHRRRAGYHAERVPWRLGWSNGVRWDGTAMPTDFPAALAVAENWMEEFSIRDDWFLCWVAIRTSFENNPTYAFFWANPSRNEIVVCALEMDTHTRLPFFSGVARATEGVLSGGPPVVQRLEWMRYMKLLRWLDSPDTAQLIMPEESEAGAEWDAAHFPADYTKALQIAMEAAKKQQGAPAGTVVDEWQLVSVSMGRRPDTNQWEYEFFINAIEGDDSIGWVYVRMTMGTLAVHEIYGQWRISEEDSE